MTGVQTCALPISILPAGVNPKPIPGWSSPVSQPVKMIQPVRLLSPQSWTPAAEPTPRDHCWTVTKPSPSAGILHCSLQDATSLPIRPGEGRLAGVTAWPDAAGPALTPNPFAPMLVGLGEQLAASPQGLDAQLSTGFIRPAAAELIPVSPWDWSMTGGCWPSRGQPTDLTPFRVVSYGATTTLWGTALLPAGGANCRPGARSGGDRLVLEDPHSTQQSAAESLDQRPLTSMVFNLFAPAPWRRPTVEAR